MVALPAFGRRRRVHDGGQRRTAVVYGASTLQSGRERRKRTGRCRSSPGTRRAAQKRRGRLGGDDIDDEHRRPELGKEARSRRHRASRVNPVDQKTEDDEAELWSTSAELRAACNGGNRRRCRHCVARVSPAREEEKARGKGKSGERQERGSWSTTSSTTRGSAGRGRTARIDRELRSVATDRGRRRPCLLYFLRKTPWPLFAYHKEVPGLYFINCFQIPDCIQ